MASLSKSFLNLGREKGHCKPMVVKGSLLVFSMIVSRSSNTSYTIIQTMKTVNSSYFPNKVCIKLLRSVASSTTIVNCQLGAKKPYQ